MLLKRGKAVRRFFARIVQLFILLDLPVKLFSSTWLGLNSDFKYTAFLDPILLHPWFIGLVCLTPLLLVDYLGLLLYDTSKPLDYHPVLRLDPFRT